MKNTVRMRIAASGGLITILILVLVIGTFSGRIDFSSGVHKMKNSQPYFFENGVVCHAGGMTDGYSTTNSPYAFDFSYENGHRFFEVDLTLTSDDALVCAHGWNESDYLSRYLTEQRTSPYQPTLEEFLDYTVGGGFPVMTFADFCVWMSSHEDAYCLLDVKLCDYGEAKYIAETILETAPGELLSRFVVSARTPDMVRGYSDAGEFPYLHLLYDSDSARDQTIYEAEDFLKFCYKNNISSISVSAADYTQEVAEKLQSDSLKTYVYMVESSYEAQRLLDMGVDFMISDTLPDDCIQQLKQNDGLGIRITRADDGLLIEWNPLSSALKYEVLRENQLTGTTEKLAVLDNGVSEYLDAGAQHGVPYTYQILAQCDGSGVSSLPGEFYWLEKTALTNCEQKEDGIRLKWEALDDADGYTVKRRIGTEGAYELIKIIDEPLSEFTDTSLPSDVTEPVCYRVQAYTSVNGTRYYSGYCPAVKISPDETDEK